MRARLALIPFLLLLAACAASEPERSTMTQAEMRARIREHRDDGGPIEEYLVRSVYYKFKPPAEWGISDESWIDITNRASRAFIDTLIKDSPKIKSRLMVNTKNGDPAMVDEFVDGSYQQPPVREGVPEPGAASAAKECFVAPDVVASLELTITGIDKDTGAVSGSLEISELSRGKVLQNGPVSAAAAAGKGFNAENFIAAHRQLALDIRSKLMAGK